MKFFIDTANVNEISEASSIGVVDGVTTNPSLVAKEGGNTEKIVSEICNIVDGPVSVEVIALGFREMLEEARMLAKLHTNIVVKIPMTIDGLKTVRQLSLENIKTNLTLVFSPLQALMAAKVGATYVSPFLGRIDDLSHRGLLIIEQISKIYNNYAYNTEIIVASVRGPMHVLDAAIAGADIATIPYGVLRKFVKHPLTDKGISIFMNDWENAGKEK